MIWRWDEVLKTHPNGMRFSVFGQEGDLLATNEYFRCALVFVSLGCQSAQESCAVWAAALWSMTRQKAFPAPYFARRN